jgi:hypothetical protein
MLTELLMWNDERERTAVLNVKETIIDIPARNSIMIKDSIFLEDVVVRRRIS